MGLMKGWRLLRLALFSALILVVVLLLASPAMAGWTVQQLTDEAQVFKANDGQVVWSSADGEDHMVYFYDTSWAPGTAPVEIARTTNPIGLVNVDSGQVVWEAFDGQDEEIYLYDTAWDVGTTPLQLSDNTYDDLGPQISGGLVAWQTKKPGPLSYVSKYEVYFYDTSWEPGTSALMLYSVADYVLAHLQALQIDSGLIAWTGGEGPGWNVHYYDSTTGLLHHEHALYRPQNLEIDAGQAVWVDWSPDTPLQVRFQDLLAGGRHEC
jgi:hypothetical protein